MEVIYNSILPKKGFVAMNLFGFIFARKEYMPISNVVVNHESIHTAQMREMLYLLFYLWYGVEWIFRLIQYRNSHKAYHNISFEREAYDNQFDLNYLKARKRYKWITYLNNKQIKYRE